jgi:hypothetical protein
MKPTLYFTLCILTVFLAACVNPGGISDEFYSKYKNAVPPKILFQCTKNGERRVGFVAGGNKIQNYGFLFNKVKKDCAEVNGVLKILKSEK